MEQLKLYHGADYNPEQWLDCPDILEQDIELMKKAHVNVVSLGIFSWSTLEPREGEFHLDWMADIIDKLYAAGISVALATPSGARPAWMAYQYPEVRRVDADRIRQLYGRRQNHCYTSPIYREKVKTIDQALARRFGTHPGVILWHISNEFGGECHCPLCQAAFQEWLQKRYVRQEETASRVIETFREFIQEKQDEITALRIIYDQRYKDRPMAIAKLKALYEKLKARNITVDRLWDCYAIKQPDKVKRGTMVQLADLVSLIRFETGATETLVPFAERVSYNFQQWSFRRNAGAVHFTEEQMEWLRLIKDHIAASLSVVLEDLDLSPFDRKGGLGRFYEVFGEDYEEILMELNVELVA